MEFGEDIRENISKSGFWYGLIGCIPKKRSIYDLVDLFDTKHQYITSCGFPNIHLKYGLVRYINTDKQRKYYKTIFDNYLDLVKEFGNKKDKKLQKIISLIENDKETWLKFWDSELFREYLCDIDLIRKKWNLKSKEKGYEKVVIAIPIQMTEVLICSLISLEKAKQHIKKSLKSKDILPLLIHYDEFQKRLLSFILDNYEQISSEIERLKLKETELWKHHLEVISGVVEDIKQLIR